MKRRTFLTKSLMSAAWLAMPEVVSAVARTTSPIASESLKDAGAKCGIKVGLQSGRQTGAQAFPFVASDHDDCCLQRSLHPGEAL